MKRYTNIFAIVMTMMMGMTLMTSCSNDEWGNDNPIANVRAVYNEWDRIAREQNGARAIE